MASLWARFSKIFLFTGLTFLFLAFFLMSGNLEDVLPDGIRLSYLQNTLFGLYVLATFANLKFRKKLSNEVSDYQAQKRALGPSDSSIKTTIFVMVILGCFTTWFIVGMNPPAVLGFGFIVVAGIFVILAAVSVGLSALYFLAAFRAKRQVT